MIALLLPLLLAAAPALDGARSPLFFVEASTMTTPREDLLCDERGPLLGTCYRIETAEGRRLTRAEVLATLPDTRRVRWLRRSHRARVAGERALLRGSARRSLANALGGSKSPVAAPLKAQANQDDVAWVRSRARALSITDEDELIARAVERFNERPKA